MPSGRDQSDIYLNATNESSEEEGEENEFDNTGTDLKEEMNFNQFVQKQRDFQKSKVNKSV